MATSTSQQNIDAPKPEDTAAMDEMARWAFQEPPSKAFPSTLKAYLQDPTHDFKCWAPPKAAKFPLHPYQIQFFQKINVKDLPIGTEIPGSLPDPERRLMAYFVKMVEAQKVEPAPPAGSSAITHRAIERFSTGDFVSLDLALPAARLVVTVQLSGCSLVIGYDKASKSILHLGHAQPSQGGNVSHSKELETHFEKAPLNNVFEGKKLSKVKVLGGFGATIVKALGWISNEKLYIALKTTNKVTIHEYP